MTTPESATDDLERLLAVLRHTADRLTDLTNSGIDDVDPAAVVRGLHALRATVATLREVDTALEVTAVRYLRDNGPLDLGGDVVARRTASATRKAWDHRGLAFRISSSAIVDASTGQIADDPQQAAKLVTDALLACARPEWRVTALRNAGIDPGDYCEEVWGAPKVEFCSADELAHRTAARAAREAVTAGGAA